MNPIQELATSFIQEHWDEIDKNQTEIAKGKSTVLNFIKEDEEYASWIVCEVMNWGTPTDYLKPFVVEADIFVIKINDKYFKLDDPKGELLVETFPKEKTVIYFE